MAEIWDYWLYSMNAPFGRTRGGEPDSPYNGFCTITHFQICRGLDQVRAHTMASPVPAVDVEVGGTADVLAHDCGESSAAGAEGARAGSKRPRAPKCKPGEETSGVQFKRAPRSWAAEVLAASTELGARRPWSGRLPAATPPRRAGAHQRRRQPAAHPRPVSNCERGTHVIHGFNSCITWVNPCNT